MKCSIINAAFHQGLHCLQRLKQPSEPELHYNLESSTSDPLKYTIGSSLLNVLICMGKFIRIQKVKYQNLNLHCKFNPNEITIKNAVS